MESFPLRPNTNQSAANPGPPIPSSPPPLPRAIQHFKVACWIGLVSGGLWTLFGGAALAGTLLMPLAGVPTGLPLFLLPPVAIVQSLAAYLLIKGRPGVLPVFCVSSILAALVLLVFGGLIFAALNLVPIILFMSNAAPRSPRTESRETEETTPATPIPPGTPGTPLESREDIY